MYIRAEVYGKLRFFPIGDIFDFCRPTLVTVVERAIKAEAIRVHACEYKLVQFPDIPEMSLDVPIEQRTEVWREVLKFESRTKNRISHSLLKYSAYWSWYEGPSDAPKLEEPYRDGISGSNRSADLLAELQDTIVECGGTPLERFYSWLYLPEYQHFAVYPYQYIKEGVWFYFHKDEYRLRGILPPLSRGIVQ